jgi:glutathione S-transferase
MRLHDYEASANCYKVRLLLAQLGLDYGRVPVDIFAGETLTAEFAAINPMRSTPVLELARGSYLPESGAILTYLAEGSELLPSDPLARAQVLRWLLFEQADVVPAIGGLRFRLLTGRLATDEPEALRRRMAGQAVLALLDAHLGEHAFLVGERYSIADIAVFGYTHAAHEAGLEPAAYPAFSEWLRRVEAQPGFMNDLQPYPPNARPGAGRSIYDG